MVTVTKQRPDGVRAAPAPNGSLLSRGVPVGDLARQTRISALIYGINRVGKTTLACQFEKPLALISFEPSPFTGGASSVTKVAGVTYFLVIPTTAWPEWERLQKKGVKPFSEINPIVGADAAVELASELKESKFRTVVIDGGTSLQDVILTELMDLPELPQQMKIARTKEDRSWGVATSDQYMDRSAKAKEVLRKFLNLPQNIIVLAKERDHNPPRDDKGNVRRDKLTRGLQLESFVAADLGQATVGWLNDACDWVCRLYIAKEVKVQTIPGIVVNGKRGEPQVLETETGRTVRRLLMKLHPNFAAGGRASDPDAVPEHIEDATPAGMHAKFMRVVRGEKTA